MTWFSCALLLLLSLYVSAMPDMKAIMSMDWAAYKVQFGKTYERGAIDEEHRSAFETSKMEVIRHNKDYRTGKTSYWKKLNKFSDMLPHEYAKLRGYVAQRKTESNAKPHIMRPDSEVPDAIDWRQKGWVTPVKNQGGCGSCYAFSSVGSLEAQHKNVTGKLVVLSEQNALDCTNGCSPANHDIVYEYIIKNKGIDTQKAYPYEAKAGKCRYKKSKIGATMSYYVTIEQGDEKALTNAVGTHGPVAVGINAMKSFEQYGGGVYYEKDCNPESLQHALLVVGYNKTEDGKDYYIVKNSWGTEDFGMEGYAYMSRNRDNNCGIATDAMYPIV